MVRGCLVLCGRPCLRMYVCMHACMYAHMHACVHVCLSVCLRGRPWRPACALLQWMLPPRGRSRIGEVTGDRSGRSREIDVGGHARPPREATGDRRWRSREIAAGAMLSSCEWSVLNPQCSVLNAQFSVLNSEWSVSSRASTVLNLQSSILNAQSRRPYMHVWQPRSTDERPVRCAFDISSSRGMNRRGSLLPWLMNLGVPMRAERLDGGGSATAWIPSTCLFTTCLFTTCLSGTISDCVGLRTFARSAFVRCTNPRSESRGGVSVGVSVPWFAVSPPPGPAAARPPARHRAHS